MTNDLHARLLAEIVRRQACLVDSGVFFGFRELEHITRHRAYLAALRKIVELHRPIHGDCDECGDESVYWPCQTVAAVAEALGIAP